MCLHLPTSFDLTYIIGYFTDLILYECENSVKQMAKFAHHISVTWLFDGSSRLLLIYCRPTQETSILTV